ncbi:MAG: hypothetical protein HY554_08920 [Elusimicrobia bacterium]|nr:hypothetical protein [Elusimicrobiota bacterium]
MKKKHAEDRMINEFEARDLGPDLRHLKGTVIAAKKRIPTSVLLETDVVRKLKAKASKRGIGYLTMMKIIVHENVDRY